MSARHLLTVIGYTSVGELSRLRERDDDSLTVDAEPILGRDLPIYAVVDSDQPPPASQDWTPHDRYTAAALTGLLGRGGDTVPIGGFVAVARQIADEAMAARGGK